MHLGTLQGLRALGLLQLPSAKESCLNLPFGQRSMKEGKCASRDSASAQATRLISPSSNPSRSTGTQVQSEKQHDQHLLKDPSCLVLAQAAVVTKILEQVSSWNEFHYQAYELRHDKDLHKATIFSTQRLDHLATAGAPHSPSNDIMHC